MGLHEISIPAHEFFEICGFPITNTFIMTLIVAGFIFVLFRFGFKDKSILPNSFQNFIELILEKILNFIDSIVNNREKTEEIFPIATTLFILILCCNLTEIIPGLGVFSIMRAPSSDINFTLALAASSMLIIHILAMRRLGVWGHLKKYLNFKNPILLFVGILEGFSELTKMFSLAIRLFGNLFAGEVLLLVVSYLFSFFLPIPFLMLEILVAFIQALIFSTLIVIFYSIAATAAEAH